MIDDERGASPDDLDFAMLETPPRRRCACGLEAVWGRAQCAACVAADQDREIARLIIGPTDVAAPSSAPSAPTIPHASYLGASDIGAILGLDPMRTPLDVWAEKTGRVARTSSPELEAGNDHEAGVVRGFERRALREGLVERVEYPGPGTLIGHEPWISREGSVLVPPRLVLPARFLVGAWRGATPDAIAHLVGGRRAVVEAKLVGGGMADAWGPEPAGPEGVPLRTVAQVHWQTMHARERWPEGEWSTAFVAADIAGTDRRLYQIPIVDETLEELLEAGREWWRAHVFADVMPEPTARDIETLGEIYPEVRREGLSPFPPSGLRELAEDYVIAREIATRHRDELRRIGAKIRALIGDGEGFRWRNGRVAWRTDARGDRRLTVTMREDRT